MKNSFTEADKLLDKIIEATEKAKKVKRKQGKDEKPSKETNCAIGTREVYIRLP